MARYELHVMFPCQAIIFFVYFDHISFFQQKNSPEEKPILPKYTVVSDSPSLFPIYLFYLTLGKIVYTVRVVTAGIMK